MSNENLKIALNKYITTLALSYSADSITEDDFKYLDKDNLIKNYSLVGQHEMTIISVFYNEELNIIPFYLECKRLERIFNIKEMIFVQNGSSDNTATILNELATYDKKINVITVAQNKGYGHGFKSGVKACSTDLVLLNHSDCQFDAYAYFTQHFKLLLSFDPTHEVILPIRRGRTIYARIRSTILRWFAFVLLKQAAREFNGQPKLFFKQNIGHIESLPDDFGFDIGIVYRLLKHSEKRLFLDSIELPRFDGKSSWSYALSGQFKLTLSYIASIIKFRKNRIT